MTDTDDGRPAFPQVPYRVHEAGKDYAVWRTLKDGMSLRDYFGGAGVGGNSYGFLCPQNYHG